MEYTEYTTLKGTQRLFHFENGYTASAIDYGYGRKEGLWEVAVLWLGEIVLDTPITNDMLGWLTWEEVLATCEQIAQLPKRGV